MTVPSLGVVSVPASTSTIDIVVTPRLLRGTAKVKLRTVQPVRLLLPVVFVLGAISACASCGMVLVSASESNIAIATKPRLLLGTAKVMLMIVHRTGLRLSAMHVLVAAGARAS